MASKSEKPPNNESSTVFLVQIVVPFVFAGVGMAFAGLLLDSVQHSPVFTAFPELFILVPALLGLKGNLEMTLASRLSTAANVSLKLQDVFVDAKVRSVVVGNLFLVQTQGIVVGALAAALTVAAGYFQAGTFDPQRAALLMSSGVATASSASFILALVMIAVIAISSKYSVDPDNVATPIAASLGDFVTLLLLAKSASTIHASDSDLSTVVIAFYAGFLPLCWYSASRCEETKAILKDGWTPVLAAMAISSAGGKILNAAIRTYPRMALYQPVINGVAGNLVAVHASRKSTSYHKGQGDGETDANIDLLLIGLVVPGHVLFNSVIAGFASSSSSPDEGSNWSFWLCYLLCCLLQVWILIKVSAKLVQYLWSKAIDPDNAAIPYLTALGDLTGGALLALTFYLTF